MGAVRWGEIYYFVLPTLALASIFSFAQAISMSPRTYYFDPHGSDGNSGLSISQALKSLSKIQELPLKPGDSIKLASGATFHGSISFPVGVEGTPENPIKLQTAGDDPATIISPDEPAISGQTGGFEVSNLILKGNAEKETKGYSGVKFWAEDKDGRKHTYLRFDHLDISGFNNGLEIGSSDPSHPGFRDVKITHVSARDNFGVGITSWDTADGKGYAHKDIYVADCNTSHNKSGNGLILSGVDGALAEYCESRSNTGKHGGVGIWAYYAKNVTFRYCIASGTRSEGGDGGGFDLDGGCERCKVEYCLAYNNDGPGYMHCDYPGSFPTRFNSISKSMSIDDGRKAKSDSIGFGFVTWGSGLDDCTVSDNVATITISDGDANNCGVLFAAYITAGKQADDVLHIKGCRFENNKVNVKAKGVAFFATDLPEGSLGSIEFKNNTFAYTSNGSCTYVDGDTGKLVFHSLSDWLGKRAQSNTETLLDGASSESDYAVLEPRDLPTYLRQNGLE